MSTEGARPYIQTGLATLVSAFWLLAIGLLLSPLNSVHIGAVGGTVLAVGIVALAFHNRWKAQGLPVMDTIGAVSPRNALAGVVVGVGCAVVGTGALGLIELSSPWAAEFLESQADLFEALLLPDNDAAIPLVFLVVAVFPGGVEEFAFRGVYRARLRALDPWKRWLWVGGLFAALHLNPITFPALLVVGIILTIAADRAGGWLTPMIAHIVLNTCNGIIWVRLDLPEDPSAGFFAALLAVGTAIAAGGLIPMRNAETVQVN